MGDVVAASGPTDCCVETNEGQSYGTRETCTLPQCIGIFLLCKLCMYERILPSCYW